MELVDRVAEELRTYRHSPMASCDLAAHILALPEIKEALAYMKAVDEAHPIFHEIREMLDRSAPES